MTSAICYVLSAMSYGPLTSNLQDVKDSKGSKGRVKTHTSYLIAHSRFRIGITCAMALWMTAPLWAASPLLECERERYYEGETASCSLTLPDCVSATSTSTWIMEWSLLGKTLKKEERELYGVHQARQVSLETPAKLLRVAPIDVIAREISSGGMCEAIMVGGVGPVLRAKTIIHLFPRDPKYWVGPEEFKNKKILVEKEAEWVSAELDALGIPYERATGRDLQAQKRFDLTLTETLLKSLDRKDPWSRWELVQLLRRELSAKQDAKDLAPGTSN